MGTDIRAFIEIKIDDRYEMLKEIDIKRDYLLFDLIGGVRGKFPPVYNREWGLPNDTSNVVKILQGGRFECEGTLSMDEFRDVAYQYLTLSLEEKPDNYDHTSSILNDTYYDVMGRHNHLSPRIVYWFNDVTHWYTGELGRNSRYPNPELISVKDIT